MNSHFEQKKSINFNSIESATHNEELLLKMSSKLLVYPCIDESFALFNPQSKSEIIIGNTEYKILSMFDGYTSSDEVIKNISGISSLDIKRLIVIFKEKGLIEGYEHKRKLSLSKFVILDFPLIKGLPNFSKKLCQYIINAMYAMALLSVVFTLLFYKVTINTIVIREIFMDIKIWHVFAYIIIFLISIFFHEMAHAIAAISAGAHVAAFRFEINNFFPGFSTVICGLTTLRKKIHLLRIELAGSITNLMLFSIGVIMYNAVSSDFLKKCFLVFYIFNLFVALFNQILILFKSDGLDVMSTILDVPELYRSNLLRLFAYNKSSSVFKNKQRLLIYYHVLSITFFTMISVLVILS